MNFFAGSATVQFGFTIASAHHRRGRWPSTQPPRGHARRGNTRETRQGVSAEVLELYERSCKKKVMDVVSEVAFPVHDLGLTPSLRRQAHYIGPHSKLGNCNDGESDGNGDVFYRHSIYPAQNHDQPTPDRWTTGRFHNLVVKTT